MIKDGWHKFKDFDIYVINGMVKRGTDKNHTRVLWPYKYDKFDRFWHYCPGVRYHTLRRRYGTVYALK